MRRAISAVAVQRNLARIGRGQPIRGPQAAQRIRVLRITGRLVPESMVHRPRSEVQFNQRALKMQLKRPQGRPNFHGFRGTQSAPRERVPGRFRPENRQQQSLKHQEHGWTNKQAARIRSTSKAAGDRTAADSSERTQKSKTSTGVASGKTRFPIRKGPYPGSDSQECCRMLKRRTLESIEPTCKGKGSCKGQAN